MQNSTWNPDTYGRNLRRDPLSMQKICQQLSTAVESIQYGFTPYAGILEDDPPPGVYQGKPFANAYCGHCPTMSQVLPIDPSLSLVTEPNLFLHSTPLLGSEN